MIIINALIYILSHFPEFLIRILLFFYNNSIIDFCTVNFNCEKLHDIAEFSNYFCLLLQFFINIKFNSLCNESFQNIILNLKKNIKVSLSCRKSANKVSSEQNMMASCL